MSNSRIGRHTIWSEQVRQWSLALGAIASVILCSGGNNLQAQALRFEQADNYSPPQQQQQPEQPAAPLLQLQPYEVEPEQQQAQVLQPTNNTNVVERPMPPQILTVAAEQQELEVIQRRSRLVVTRSNIVRTAIADPSVIDLCQYGPNELSIIGMEMGSTTLTIWFQDNPEPLIYLVTTIPDPSLEERQRIDYGKLERKLGVLFPDSKVYLIPVSGKIVVKGQARDAEEAALILQIIRGEVINQVGSLLGPQPQPAVSVAAYQDQVVNPLDLASTYIVNMLEVPGEYQVMLRVTIAELNRSQMRRAGINFEYLINDGRHAVSYGLGGLPSTLTGILDNGEVSVLLNLLASNGTAKILSEPVLTVLSGHPASFLSGGEFAVPTIVGIGGAQGQQTTFRGFGTSLIVTPTVLDKDLIRMRIVPEFSAINQGNAVNNVPGLDSRRVQTTVELREGQTIAVAGLVSHQMSTEVTRIPFLGELPYIGPKLFAGKTASQDQTELLILVTPELVRPMDADEVPPLPGHEVTHPNDWELYHGAMSEGVPNQGVYQLAPYGSGASYGVDVGYHLYNPAPATPMYSPVPTYPYGHPVDGGVGNVVAPGTPYQIAPPPAEHHPGPMNGKPQMAPNGNLPLPQPPSTDPSTSLRQPQRIGLPGKIWHEPVGAPAGNANQQGVSPASNAVTPSSYSGGLMRR